MRKRTRPVPFNRLPTEFGVEAIHGCSAEDRRHLLVPYVFGRCDDEQESDFEIHLLECESCFEDLSALGRTRSLLEQFIVSQPALLASRKSRRNRLRALLVASAVLALAVAALGGYALGVVA